MPERRGKIRRLVGNQIGFVTLPKVESLISGKNEKVLPASCFGFNRPFRLFDSVRFTAPGRLRPGFGGKRLGCKPDFDFSGKDGLVV